MVACSYHTLTIYYHRHSLWSYLKANKYVYVISLLSLPWKWGENILSRHIRSQFCQDISVLCQITAAPSTRLRFACAEICLTFVCLHIFSSLFITALQRVKLKCLEYTKVANPGRFDRSPARLELWGWQQIGCSNFDVSPLCYSRLVKWNQIYLSNCQIGYLSSTPAKLWKQSLAKQKNNNNQKKSSLHVSIYSL